MTNTYDWNLRAQITRWVDDYQPGIIECRFKDASGHEWVVIEKLPIVTSANLWSDSPYPQPALIPCEVVSRTIDGNGREIAEISTGKPFAIETTDGVTAFTVFADQLIHP